MICPVEMSALNHNEAPDFESRADELFNELSAAELSELLDDASYTDLIRVQAALCEFSTNQNPANSVAKQNALLAAVQQSVRPQLLKKAGGE
jgi:hypothetical protein